MRFLIAADKFKGSLSNEQVAQAIRSGIENVFSKSALGSLNMHDSFIDVVTVSDGGDGFLLAIADALADQQHAFEIRVVEVKDAIGREIEADYLLDSSTNFAYVELAIASGLAQIEPADRDPLFTTTYGTGLLIRHAIENGATRVFVGLGGSATNDAGMGIAAALGCRFLDAEGNSLLPIGDSLSRVASIDTSDLIKLVPIVAVNDVTNPLHGPDGAAHVYAAQKGASQPIIEELDQGLQNFASVVGQTLTNKKDIHLTKGSGAAGGVGYGLQVFCDATFIAGTEIIFECMDLYKRLEEDMYDMVITGEGKIDSQTLFGKVVSRVGELAYPHDVYVVAFCGTNELTTEQSEAMGIGEVIAIHDATKNSIDESIANAEPMLAEAAEAWFQREIDRILEEH